MDVFRFAYSVCIEMVSGNPVPSQTQICAISDLSKLDVGYVRKTATSNSFLLTRSEGMFLKQSPIGAFAL